MKFIFSIFLIFASLTAFCETPSADIDDSVYSDLSKGMSPEEKELLKAQIVKNKILFEEARNLSPEEIQRKQASEQAQDQMKLMEEFGKLSPEEQKKKLDSQMEMLNKMMNNSKANNN